MLGYTQSLVVAQAIFHLELVAETNVFKKNSATLKTNKDFEQQCLSLVFVVQMNTIFL